MILISNGKNMNSVINCLGRNRRSNPDRSVDHHGGAFKNLNFHPRIPIECVLFVTNQHPPLSDIGQRGHNERS